SAGRAVDRRARSAPRTRRTAARRARRDTGEIGARALLQRASRRADRRWRTDEGPRPVRRRRATRRRRRRDGSYGPPPVVEQPFDEERAEDAHHEIDPEALACPRRACRGLARGLLGDAELVARADTALVVRA